MADSNVKVEGWDALAEVLGIMRSLNSETSVPSVEITMDSKGTVKPTVKVYNPDPWQAMKDCTEIFDTLRRTYGLVE